MIEKFHYAIPIHVRWSDIDELHHVNNAVYLTYFEEARLRYMNEVLSWDWAINGLILAHASVDYRAPLFLQDDPTLHIRCTSVGTKSLEHEYLLVDKNKKMIAQGKTIMVRYDYTTQKTIPFEESVRQMIVKFEGNSFEV